MRHDDDDDDDYDDDDDLLKARPSSGCLEIMLNKPGSGNCCELDHFRSTNNDLVCVTYSFYTHHHTKTCCHPPQHLMS